MNDKTTAQSSALKC